MGKINKFICTECRSEYISGNDAIPQLVVWHNGHVCVPKLYAEQDDKRIKKTKVSVEDEIWTTWYN
jgi:hypothetical protein|tara:strand:+ start:159 stop:356 length:198 start_codon:yes stop_codon:yes gene_type:complete